jgi:hypothetical protein
MNMEARQLVTLSIPRNMPGVTFVITSLVLCYNSFTFCEDNGNTFLWQISIKLSPFMSSLTNKEVRQLDCLSTIFYIILFSKNVKNYSLIGEQTSFFQSKEMNYHSYFLLSHLDSYHAHHSGTWENTICFWFSCFVWC